MQPGTIPKDRHRLCCNRGKHKLPCCAVLCRAAPRCINNFGKKEAMLEMNSFILCTAVSDQCSHLRQRKDMCVPSAHSLCHFFCRITCSDTSANRNDAVCAKIAHNVRKRGQIMFPCDDGIGHCGPQQLRSSGAVCALARQDSRPDRLECILQIEYPAVIKITCEKCGTRTIHSTRGEHICRRPHLPCDISLRITVNPPAALGRIPQNTQAKDTGQRKRKHEKRGICPLFL